MNDEPSEEYEERVRETDALAEGLAHVICSQVLLLVTEDIHLGLTCHLPY